MKYRISFTIESTTSNTKKIKGAIREIDIHIKDEIITYPNYITIKEIKNKNV